MVIIAVMSEKFLIITTSDKVRLNPHWKRPRCPGILEKHESWHISYCDLLYKFLDYWDLGVDIFSVNDH